MDCNSCENPDCIGDYKCPEWVVNIDGDVDCKQLVKDMWKNIYALYHESSCLSHHDVPREGYEYLPELLARIKKVVNDD